MVDSQQQGGFFQSLQGRQLSRDAFLKILLAISLTVLLVLLFPRGEAIELDYKVGSVWARKDLISPFSFPVYREEAEFNADVAAARNNAVPVFESDGSIGNIQIAGLDSLFDHLEYVAIMRTKWLRVPADSTHLRDVTTRIPVTLTEQEWDLLASLKRNGGLLKMRLLVLRSLRSVFEVGVLDRSKDSLKGDVIALLRGTVEEQVPIDHVYDRADVIAMLEEQLHSAFGGDNDSASLGMKLALPYVRSSLLLNRAATNLAIQAAIQAVPRTLGVVQENERIISKHELITAGTKLKLESLRRSRADRGPESSGTWQIVGVGLHVGLVLALYGIYLYLFRKRIWENNRRLTLIGFLILVEGAFAYISRELNVTVPVEYLIFVPTASMLLTITFDSRVGFYGTVIISFLVAGVRGNDYSIALASLIAGSLAVYSVRDMKNRTQIFRSLGFIFLGYALTICALALERFEVDIMPAQLGFAAANAIISPVLTYGLLIFVEKVFKVTTDLTLIELAQFNHPLLRQLAERAPGTYHHSMTMASLAEAAAAAVGANEVLARVGACFHDIGKIEKPNYFVENQKGSRNRHDKLSPRMSSLIIAAHVKEGIALGREHKLPPEVLDFIPMHHGTTRIEYFYQKALQLAQKSDDETKVDEIKEQDYRYPGPKPQTKETGILMLADAIEATARALEDPAPQKLEVVIDDLIRKRFEEGELDECPLTLKDLTKIKAAFLGVLVGVYHSRIKYPAEEARAKKRTKPPVIQDGPQDDVADQSNGDGNS